MPAIDGAAKKTKMATAKTTHARIATPPFRILIFCVLSLRSKALSIHSG